MPVTTSCECSHQCVKGNSLPTTRAVVIGGSIAGMCAARVLSDFVDTVTIIERDGYPSAHDFRPGVPQARHVHNLLARGLREFEGLFRGFEHRMREWGLARFDSNNLSRLDPAQPLGDSFGDNFAPGHCSRLPPHLPLDLLHRAA